LIDQLIDWSNQFIPRNKWPMESTLTHKY